MLPTLRACVRPGALAVSLIKGLDFAEDKPVLVSQIIREGMGPAASEVCVLMGANVADEVARDEVGRCVRGALGSFWVYVPARIVVGRWVE